MEASDAGVGRKRRSRRTGVGDQPTEGRKKRQDREKDGMGSLSIATAVHSSTGNTLLDRHCSSESAVKSGVASDHLFRSISSDSDLLKSKVQCGRNLIIAAAIESSDLILTRKRMQGTLNRNVNGRWLYCS